MTPAPPVPAEASAYAAVRSSWVRALVRRSLLVLRGTDAFDFLHRLTTNDLRSLAEGASRRTIVVDEKGRVIDRVSVSRRGNDALLLCSPGLSETLASWFDRFIITDDVLVAASYEAADVLAVAGPNAPDIAGGLPAGVAIREDLGSIPFFLFPPAGPGARGTPVSLPPGLPEIDADTLDAVRIEEGVPVIGRELGPEVNALEAGLMGEISFTKGCYIGQEVIARLDTYKKLRRIIAGFTIEAPDGVTPAPGLLRIDGAEAGRITSVARSPRTGDWIGLGFRRLSAAESALFALDSTDGGPPLRCRCVTKLPAGYEGYAAEA